MKTCSRMCKTCIMSARSPISPERLADLEREWTKLGAEKAQLCHQFHVGEDEVLTPDAVICRGYLERTRSGELTAPSLVQVAERLGWLSEVDPKDG